MKGLTVPCTENYSFLFNVAVKWPIKGVKLKWCYRGQPNRIKRCVRSKEQNRRTATAVSRWKMTAALLPALFFFVWVCPYFEYTIYFVYLKKYHIDYFLYFPSAIIGLRPFGELKLFRSNFTKHILQILTQCDEATRTWNRFMWVVLYKLHTCVHYQYLLHVHPSNNTAWERGECALYIAPVGHARVVLF